MADVVLVFADEDISGVFLKSDKKTDFLETLKGKLFPPLGLLYLGKILEEANISVEILDLLALDYSVEKALRRIESEKPKIIGFSLQSSNLHKTCRIIKGIRNRLGARIVLGGPHLIHSPDAVQYLSADFGIIGDGEHSFKKLALAILNNSSFEDIEGLIWKENGKIMNNGRALIQDLDSLPFPARHLWRHQCFSPLLANNVATLLTSRGCIYDCIFCGLPDKRIYRNRGIPNVMDEFVYLYNLGYRHVELQDDFFTFNRERVIGICEELLRRHLRIKWTCVTRADYVDDELLRLMKKSGCTHIKYGIECASERLRNVVIGKNISCKKIKNGIKATKKAGIYSVGYFVLGIPTETQEDIKNTIHFAYNLGLDYLDFHLTLIISGSRLFKRALREGKVKQNLWEEVAHGKKPIPIYVSDNLDIKRMQQMIFKGLTGFYFAPRFLFRELFFHTKDFRNLYNKTRLVCLMVKSIAQQILSVCAAKN